MISISRSSLALFCALAFVISASPARSTIFTDTAPLVSPPVVVTTSNPLPVTFDFGQTFASITSVSISLTFAGDLLDMNEGWSLDGGPGQINLGAMSQSVAHLNLNPGDTAIYADLLDGTFSTNITGLDWYTTSSFGLESISLQIDATPLASVPEPATLALLAAGLVSVAGMRRRRA